MDPVGCHGRGADALQAWRPSAAASARSTRCRCRIDASRRHRDRLQARLANIHTRSVQAIATIPFYAARGQPLSGGTSTYLYAGTSTTHSSLSKVVMSYVSRVRRGMTKTRASLPSSASDALANASCCRARSSCASRRPSCSCARHSAPISSAWLPVHAARCTPVSRVHTTALPACSSRAAKRVLDAHSSPTSQKSSGGAAHLDLDDGGS